MLHLTRFARQFSTVPNHGFVALQTANRICQVTGPDAAKFLNGLVTLKLLPSVDKKNMTSITEQDLEQTRASRELQYTEHQLENSNWGIINEDEFGDEVHRIGIRRDGRYGMMLTSKGRMLSDFFLYPDGFLGSESKDDLDAATFANSSSVPTIPSYLMEFNCSDGKFRQVFMTMKMHKLKSQVDITKVSDLQSWLYFNRSDKFQDYLFDLKEKYFNNSVSKSPEAALELASQLVHDDVLFRSGSYGFLKKYLRGFVIDDREPMLGIRMVFDNSQRQPFESIFSNSFHLKFAVPLVSLPSDSPVYKQLRITEGIVEAGDYASGAKESLPFENNLDYMNGVNYNKGCYVGQELTIRTHIRDSVRRRVMPVQFYTSKQADGILDTIQLDPVDPVIKALDDIKDLELVSIPAKYSGTAAPAPREPTQPAPSNPFGVGVKPRPSRGKVGSVICRTDNIGFASVDQNFIDRASYNDVETNRFSVVSKTSPVADIECKVYVPEWWPEEEEEEEEDEEV